MLSRQAISRRMYTEGPNLTGMRLQVYNLHTESVFAMENYRLGFVDIARDINMPAARKAYYSILRRLKRGENLTPKISQAVLAYEQARYLLR